MPFHSTLHVTETTFFTSRGGRLTVVWDTGNAETVRLSCGEETQVYAAGVTKHSKEVNYVHVHVIRDCNAAVEFAFDESLVL